MPVAINQDVKALSPAAGTSPAYLLRLLQYIQPSADAAAVGSTVKGIRIQDYLSIAVPMAPSEEQGRIAEILDTLDTTIRQTEAIIEKLKQVKQGLLHDLLTRGIDANGELRPPQSQAPHLYKGSSLGWIPREWTACRLLEVATLVTSGSRGWAAHYADSGALFLRSQNVRMGHLDFSDRQHVKPPTGSEGQRTKLEPLDLLVTITGNSVGNVAHVPANWEEIGFVSQHVGLVRLGNPQCAEIATQYLMRGSPGNQQLINAQYGQSKPGLSLENLRNLTIPAPPDPERPMITQRLSSAQKHIEREVDYLTQLHALKFGLMDDLLTGRVRVTPLLGATPA
jgi:type I restriction enzyme, S subunit